MWREEFQSVPDRRAGCRLRLDKDRIKVPMLQLPGTNDWPGRCAYIQHQSLARRPSRRSATASANCAGDPQVKGYIVARANGNNAERCRAAYHSPRNTIDGSITACHDDQLDAPLDCVTHLGFNRAIWAYHKHFRQNILVLHLGKDIDQLSRRFLRSTGYRIKDEFCPEWAAGRFGRP